MARVVVTHFEEPRSCPYLNRPLASLEHRVMLDVSAQEADDLLDRGWRHFGPGWFRPVCSGCQACISTRIVVGSFVASRSQRRVQRASSRLHAEVGPPRVDSARLELFEAWHANRVKQRGWEATSVDEREYFMQFAFPTAIAREVAYYDDASGGRLVMVAICDETPRSWNAVFCYYDPAVARLSPGIANILALIDLARVRGQPYVHLGYCVSDCLSLRYKEAFHPQEVLLQLPADGEEPRWQPARGLSDTPLRRKRL